MTNHDMLVTALRRYKGKTLSTSEIKRITLEAFPLFNEGSLLPNDHADGNQCPCSCAETDSRIFDRVGRGMYRVR